jgi:hypothetical protein
MRKERLRRLEQNHSREVQRRAIAEDAALLQLRDDELGALLFFIRKNVQHLPAIELGTVSQLRSAPDWATPNELAVAVRYERLYFAALEHI